MKHPTNPSTTFGVTLLIASAGGIAVAFAENRGLLNARMALTAIGFASALYFIVQALAIPYMRFSANEAGIRFIDRLNGVRNVRWSDIVRISALRCEGELEWHIQTANGDNIFIIAAEILLSHRLPNAVAKHLQHFDRQALNQALSTREEGQWEVFRAKP